MEWTIDSGWPEAPGACARYLGTAQDNSPAGQRAAPARYTVLRGRVDVRVSFEKGLPRSQARIVFGRNLSDGSYMCAGVGGYGVACAVDKWLPREKVLRPLRVSGEQPLLSGPCELELSVVFHGREITVLVDTEEQLTTVLPDTLGRTRLGLFAWGDEEITFTDLTIQPEDPQAFVAMQFDGYDEIFEDVIKRPLEDAGVFVDRVDRHTHAANILEDIKQTIKDADVVVAEITPKNENVFYEVGYAQALGAPTILLVRKGRRLPFDVRHERCIEYENTPAGRNAAARNIVKAVKAMKLV